MARFECVSYPIKEGSQIPKTTEYVPKSYLEIAHSKNIENNLEKIANIEKIVLFYCLATKDRTWLVTAKLI